MTNDFRFAFFGSPEFASIILEKLIQAGFKPAVVVCAPDAPVGRKKVLTFPPTKLLAQKHNIPVYQPEKLEIRNWKLEIGEIDFAIVAAYSKILKKEILEIPRLGTIGVHPSLLPKYRGASPIQSAILGDEKETGATLYLMDEKIDHGSIVSNVKCQVSSLDTYETLLKKLAELSGDLVVETLPKFIKGEAKLEPQDESKATFTKKIFLKDGKVDLENDLPRQIWLKIRALNPEPGVFAELKLKNGKNLKLKLLEADYNPSVSGQVLFLKVVQPEGKKPMAYKNFLNGYK